MGQFSEFYNLDLLDVNTPPGDKHVRLFRNKNAARNPVDANAPFLVKHSDGYLEPLSAASGEAGLSSIENGQFSISADGSTGTINGAPVVPVNNLDGTWTMTIPTLEPLALGHFNSFSNTIVDINNYKYSSSYGKDNGVFGDCLVTLNQKVAGVLFVAMVVDVGNSINVQDQAGNGWTAIVQNITPVSYDILWTQAGTGLIVTSSWHGVMG